MNTDNLIKVSIGFMIGAIFTVVLVSITPGSIFKDGKAAIKECERELPRNVKCMVTAIPIED